MRANPEARHRPSEAGVSDVVSLAAELAAITEHWRPRVVGGLNGQEVKLVKFQGEFVWHHHESEDELFLGVAGRFRVEFRDRAVEVGPGEFVIVPRGVEHRTVAEREASVMLFEPAGVRNTGNVEHPTLTAPGAAAAPHAFDFLPDTYATERLKTLSVWSQFRDDDMGFRPDPRARTPLEQMIHQCVSEDTWMRTMLGIEVSLPPLPAQETRLEFLGHYAAASAERLAALRTKAIGWYGEMTSFFDVPRSRSWVLVRRMTHSSHHRGQLTSYLRMLHRGLYSTYGPTADTGGLFQDQAPVIYRYESVEDLLEAEHDGGAWPPLSGAPGRKVTERGEPWSPAWSTPRA